MKRRASFLTPLFAAFGQSAGKRQFSGVYPQLAMFNVQGESWAGSNVETWNQLHKPT